MKALFHNLSIGHSGQRSCDIVKMKIGDIVAGGTIKNRATVMQQKTKRPVQFEIMTEARQTLLKWLNRRGGILSSQAVSITWAISAPANMHGWLTSGSVQSALMCMNTGRIHCSERRPR